MKEITTKIFIPAPIVVRRCKYCKSILGSYHKDMGLSYCDDWCKQMMSEEKYPIKICKTIGCDEACKELKRKKPYVSYVSKKGKVYYHKVGKVVNHTQYCVKCTEKNKKCIKYAPEVKKKH